MVAFSYLNLITVKTKTFITLLTLCVSMAMAQKKTAAPKITANKTAIVQSVDKHSAELIQVSDKIWAAEEIAFHETESAKLLADYAEANGFKVERGVAEIPTAFVATYGSGSPV